MSKRANSNQLAISIPLQGPSIESLWGERRGLNPRQPGPQPGALPAELRPPSLYDLANHTARLLLDVLEDRRSIVRQFRDGISDICECPVIAGLLWR